MRHGVRIIHLFPIAVALLVATVASGFVVFVDQPIPPTAWSTPCPTPYAVGTPVLGAAFSGSSFNISVPGGTTNNTTVVMIVEDTSGCGTVSPPSGSHWNSIVSQNTPAGRPNQSFQEVWLTGYPVSGITFTCGSGAGAGRWITRAYANVGTVVTSAGLTTSSANVTQNAASISPSGNTPFMLVYSYSTDGSNSGSDSFTATGFGTIRAQGLDGGGRAIAYIDGSFNSTGGPTGGQSATFASAQVGAALSIAIQGANNCAAPTATPTPGTLQSDVTTLAGDTNEGHTNPLPGLCATAASNGTCTTQGSQSTSGIDMSGATDAGATINTKLASGDLNLPSGTYLINTMVTLPTWRTLQFQPGATIINTTPSMTLFSLSNNQTTLFTPNITSVASGSVGIAISGTQSNVIGASTPSLNISGAKDVQLFNSISGTYTTTGATHLMATLYNVAGTMSPALPYPAGMSGGTALQRDLWQVMKDLGATGSTGSFTACGSGVGGCNTGGTDQTSVTNSILSSGNVMFQTGTFTYAQGPLSAMIVPANRILLGQPGSSLYWASNQSGSTAHSLFGGCYNVGEACNANVSFFGMRMTGVYTTAGSVPTGGYYNELVHLASSQGVGQQQYYFIGDDFAYCAGDCFITYAGTSSQTSGPSDILVAFSHFFQAQQPNIHVNGGQGVHVMFNENIDGGFSTEIDASTKQYEAIHWTHNFQKSVNGQFWNIAPQHYTNPEIDCSGNTGKGQNSSACYMNNNVADGTGSPTGVAPNNWITNSITNGCSLGNFNSNPAVNGGGTVFTTC